MLAVVPAMAACATSTPPPPAPPIAPSVPQVSPAASPAPSPSPLPTHPAALSPARTHAFALSSRAGFDLAVVTRRPSAGRGEGPITVVQLDPARTRLVLHAGTTEPAAGLTWRHGGLIGSSERAGLIAVFNGGFKLKDARGGWMSEGRLIAPLRAGAASVVIYRDGSTDIGAWGREVPRAGKPIASVRQNLEPLIDHGRPQHTRRVAQPLLNRRWGHAFREQYLVSRSALGITATGALVWAAGTKVTVAALADALVAKGVVRALELDINAPLVRGFLFPGATTVTTHGRPTTTPLPLVAGQTQTVVRPPQAQHCTYLDACSRDFFTVTTRRDPTSRS